MTPRRASHTLPPTSTMIEMRESASAAPVDPLLPSFTTSQSVSTLHSPMHGVANRAGNCEYEKTRSETVKPSASSSRAQ